MLQLFQEDHSKLGEGAMNFFKTLTSSIPCAEENISLDFNTFHSRTGQVII